MKKKNAKANYCQVVIIVFFVIEISLKLIASCCHRHFFIYTESFSALETLQPDACSPTFISILELYNKLTKKGFNILFCWVPGHVGVKDNEVTDNAAEGVWALILSIALCQFKTGNKNPSEKQIANRI